MKEAERMVQEGYRYALALTHNREDAEDLVQDAWLKLRGKEDSLPDKPLLFITIRHGFIDRLRRDNLVPFHSMEDMGEKASSEPEPEGAWSDEQWEYALAKLRVEEREALFLNVMEGFTAGEIADKTGNNRNAVLSLLSRGKKKLARWLLEVKSPGHRAGLG